MMFKSMSPTLQTDVVIVGAGSTEFSLAVQLLCYNINFAIIDQKEGVTERSKAIVVHARTLEIYDQVGLAERAIAGGESFQKLKRELEKEYGKFIAFHLIPLYPRVVEIFGWDHLFSVLLRPNNYIALLSPDCSLGSLKTYFNQVLTHA